MKQSFLGYMMVISYYCIYKTKCHILMVKQICAYKYLKLGVDFGNEKYYLEDISIYSQSNPVTVEIQKINSWN